LLLGNSYHNSCCSRIQLVLKSSPFQLLAFVLQELLDSWFELHHEFNLDEGLGEGLSEVTFFECFSLEKDLQEVGSHVLGYLSSSMSVEHSVESHVRESWDVVIGNKGILHIFPPSLHFADGILVVSVLFPILLLGGDRLIQKAISHYYLLN